MKHLRNWHAIFLRKSFFHQFLIVFVLCFITFLIWFFFIFDNLSIKLDQINNEVLILKSNKILLSKLIKQKESNSNLLLDLIKQIQVYQTNINLNHIISKANHVGLELVNYGICNALSEAKEQKEVIVPLNFKGSFKQILQFFEYSFEKNVIFNFSKLKITKLENEKLNLEIIFNTINKH